MTKKFLLLQVSWIVLCATGFVVYEVGSRHGMGMFLQNQVFAPVQRFNSYLTDLRYGVRGSRPTQNPIVIVEIDETSIEMLGRWPWRRDYVAYVIDKIYEAGASYVGLDLFFSEPQVSVPEELEETLRQKNLQSLLKPFDFDEQIEDVVRKHRDRLVLAWASESECRPAFSESQYCPVNHPEALATHPDYFAKFSVAPEIQMDADLMTRTPLSSVSTLIPNLERFEKAALYDGFVNDYRDKDGLVRRTSLLTMVGGKPYATLPLLMAKLWKQEDLDLKIDASGRVEKFNWKQSQAPVGVNELGVARINFRGAERSFPYIPVRDVLSELENKAPGTRDLASESKLAPLKGAIVLVGLTAIGLTKDVVATPFDPTMPGVEVHANIIDNLLSNDFLQEGGVASTLLPLLLTLILGSILLMWMGRKLEARPALFLSLALVGILLLIDLLILFPANLNLDLAFHYLAFSGTIAIGVAAKHISEEQNRKFLRSAFSMYVAPAVVDNLVKDPKQLSLGGRKEQVTVLFSDVRSFTTYSERMEPKMIGEFLNDYLGMQTEIVFAHGGTLDKYIGDALMAFWGAPLQLPNHATLACQAVIAMMESLEKHQGRLFERYGIPVKIGIGLHSGEVNVGNMGSARSFNYTVLGDNVNLSSRLEGATKFFGVTTLTTRETIDLAKQHAHFQIPHRSILEVKVKGKSKNVELIELRTAPLSDLWMKSFEEAKALFKARKFAEASRLYVELSKTATPGQEQDGPCNAMVEFCQYFLKNPPRADWDGSWTLENK